MSGPSLSLGPTHRRAIKEDIMDIIRDLGLQPGMQTGT